MSDKAVEILADHLSPYVGEALAQIKAEAPHILNLYRERAEAAIADLEAHQIFLQPMDGSALRAIRGIAERDGGEQ